MDLATLTAAVTLLYFVGTFALLILMGVFQGQFILRLRKHHPEIWSDLGQPAVLLGLFPDRWDVSSSINHYFRVHDFRLLTDQGTRGSAERLWWIRRAFLSYVIGGAAIVLAFVGFAKWRAV